MGMSLRVVVPPHPLIAHWLTLLRDQATPPALYATAMAELGRWLTYEALRDWLPHRRVSIQTSHGSAEGDVVDGGVELLAVPLLRAGLGLWQGGQAVLPAARVAHVGVSPPLPGAAAAWYLDALPDALDERTGVLLFACQVASGETLAAVLQRLQGLGVGGRRLRVITALSAGPGLRLLGERFPELTLYTACIDAGLNGDGAIVPGIGNPEIRLFAGAA